ncbi:MAG TPA: hypothetical protein VKP58_01775 [Candidatus Acidoferrum sp.]|nr:hypothetical protein [Candidatus Acidoferrum sp.]
MPCTAPVKGRGLFCLAHRDAVDGALLGLHAAKAMRPRKKSCAKRRAAIVGVKESCTPQEKSGISRAPKL